ncbi:hypothetical protein ASG82_25495 [Mycobacterium sp. Soil538]|nr:hypothetical protein ASG82_25495 [Mycobacterium sp. Soil538]
MDAAFAACRHQILGEMAAIEQVDIARAVQAPMVSCIDEITVPVRMRAEKRLEHRAGGGIENRCDVVTSTAAHPYEGAVISFLAQVVQCLPGDVLAFSRAQVDVAVHEILRVFGSESSTLPTRWCCCPESKVPPVSCRCRENEVFRPHLGYIRYAVAIAQCLWMSPDEVINT